MCEVTHVDASLGSSDGISPDLQTHGDLADLLESLLMLSCRQGRRFSMAFRYLVMIKSCCKLLESPSLLPASSSSAVAGNLQRSRVPSGFQYLYATDSLQHQKSTDARCCTIWCVMQDRVRAVCCQHPAMQQSQLRNGLGC